MVPTNPACTMLATDVSDEVVEFRIPYTLVEGGHSELGPQLGAMGINFCGTASPAEGITDDPGCGNLVDSRQSAYVKSMVTENAVMVVRCRGYADGNVSNVRMRTLRHGGTWNSITASQAMSARPLSSGLVIDGGPGSAAKLPPITGVELVTGNGPLCQTPEPTDLPTWGREADGFSMLSEASTLTVILLCDPNYATPKLNALELGQCHAMANFSWSSACPITPSAEHVAAAVAGAPLSVGADDPSVDGWSNMETLFHFLLCVAGSTIILQIVTEGATQRAAEKYLPKIVVAMWPWWAAETAEIAARRPPNARRQAAKRRDGRERSSSAAAMPAVASTDANTDVAEEVSDPSSERSVAFDTACYLGASFASALASAGLATALIMYGRESRGFV